MPTGVELATAWVRIVPSFDGVQESLTKELSGGSGVENAGAAAGGRFTKGAKSGLKGLAAVIGGAFVVSTVTDFFRDSIGNARDLAEAGTAVGEIFGDSFGDISIWADAANASLGQSELQALNAAKTFGIYGQAAGLAGDENVEFSKQMAELATDLASFHNTSPEEAIEALGAGLRGEAEPLRRFGVLLDDATLRQKALQLGLIATTKEALTPQQRVLAAQAAIMEQTTVAQGDFARTSGGLANQQRILDATMTDLSATAGAALLPAINAIVGAMVPFLGFLGDNQPVLIAVGVAIGGILVGAFIAWTASIWAANAALLANPITWIVLAIAALVAGIIWVATQTTIFQDIWNGAMSVIGAVATWLWETILKPVFDAIGAIFTWLWTYIIQPVITGIMIYVGLWAAIFTWLWGSVISPVFAAIGAIFQWVWASIIQPIINYVIAALQGWGVIFNWLNNAIVKPVFAAVGAVFQWLWNSVISPVANFISTAMTNVGNTIRSVFSGIAGFIGAAFQAVLGVVRGPINALIGMVNGVIGGLNSIHVSIPDWVPIVGGQTFGLSIPRIPQLAEGATILPKPGGTLAILGEGGRAESVVDTGLMNRALEQLTAGGAGGGDGQFTGKLYLSSGEFLGMVDGRIEKNGRNQRVKLENRARPAH